MVTVNSILLGAVGGCASIEPNKQLPPKEEVVDAESNAWARLPATVVEDVPGGLFLSRTVDGNIPRRLLTKNIRIHLSEAANIGDIALALGRAGLNMVVGSALNDRERSLTAAAAPVRDFEGCLGSYLSVLSDLLNIGFVWKDGVVAMLPEQQYAVVVPQHDEVITAITKELEALGATDVVPSLRAGQVSYRTSPKRNKDVIAPYLRRLSRNAVTVTLQVAVVTVSLRRDTNVG
ncbi:MAG: hypothetical protein K2Q10_00615, partial [Rhodospirillales bacterium]|nr:hypothetical protein [Rhodospirillales bacterium]